MMDIVIDFTLKNHRLNGKKKKFYNMDARIKNIMIDIKLHDNSFKERPSGLELLFGRTKYTQEEMRETWFLGIEYGIEYGFNEAGLDGQKIQINSNITNKRHKEFIDKFYKLSQEYGCAIQYHPRDGIVVIDREY